jgi:hypothetical protein
MPDSVKKSILLNPRVWIALLVMLAVDLVFQLGGYNRFASRDSHSGTTLRTLSALNLRGRDQIDTVTIGSSVAVYGLDHARIAQAASAQGHLHVSLALPGSALLTYRQWAKWLPKNAPKVRGGLMVLAPGDFQSLGNGSYELAIVAPIKSLGDGLWWQEHVPFVRENLDTYGLFSGLALFRNDLQQLIANPLKRRGELRWWREHLRQSDYLSTQTAFDGNLCGIDLSSSDSCLAAVKPEMMPEADFQAVQQTCQTLKAQSSNVPDWTNPANVPAETRRVQNLRRELISELGWQDHAVVLVLPMHPMWETTRVKGAAALMAEIYQPQVASGSVRFLNYQNIFDEAGVAPCEAFHDMYHLNRLGQKIVTDKLLPELAWLYR